MGTTHTFARKEVVTTAPHMCAGCRCLLPKGSKVVTYKLWHGDRSRRVWVCPHCAEVIATCTKYPGVDIWNGRRLHGYVNERCHRCDRFISCRTADHLRTHRDGLICLDAIGPVLDKKDAVS